MDSKLIKKCNEIINTIGKYIIAGGISVHTYFNLDIGVIIANKDILY